MENARQGKAVEKREFEGCVRPVSPGDSGGGLPYAPQHWPNPGDIWVWRVGHRISKSGIFMDRYLRLPQSLHKGKTKPLEFQSKPAVERYVRSHFPEADISAFFASFTWVIRAKPELIGTYVYCPRIKRSLVKKPEKNNNLGVRDDKRMRGALRTAKEEKPSRNHHDCIKNLTAGNGIASKGERTRLASSTGLVSGIASKGEETRLALSTGLVVSGIASNGKETRLAPSTGLASSSLLKSRVSGAFNDSQAHPRPASSTGLASSSLLRSRVSGEFKNSQAHPRPASSTGLASSSLLRSRDSSEFNISQADPRPEEFDNYLKNLDENLDYPVSMHEPSSSMQGSMKESRKKLSSLLAMTTPYCLLTSEDNNELIVLSYKLQNDPNLSMEELSILKLIQSIPFISKSFLEAKEISSKAVDFLCGLNTKITTVASLKEEYNSSKKEIKDVKANEASARLRMMDIDQKISKLEKLKQEEAGKIEVYGEKLIRLNSVQKMVMGTLPKVVDEVQIAKSEKSIWELKRKKAAEFEDEILARFAPLDGFFF